MRRPLLLLAKPTPHGAGILLSGDGRDLESLHETIHFLSNGVPLGGEFDDLVLGLAYDVRKAMEDQRETLAVETDYGEELSYKGERVLWPTFLLQLALLRWSAEWLRRSVPRRCQQGVHCSFLEWQSSVQESSQYSADA